MPRACLNFLKEKNNIQMMITQANLKDDLPPSVSIE